MSLAPIGVGGGNAARPGTLGISVGQREQRDHPLELAPNRRPGRRPPQARLVFEAAARARQREQTPSGDSRPGAMPEQGMRMHLRPARPPDR
eukprot:3252006-Pyramimonas_sp.AAC.1